MSKPEALRSRLNRVLAATADATRLVSVHKLQAVEIT